jgi:hypothetical protein
MKLRRLGKGFVWVALALVLAACGGGGGGTPANPGNPGDPGDPTDPNSYPISGTYLQFRSLATNSLVDPLNLTTGVTLQGVFAYYVNGERFELPISSFSVASGTGITGNEAFNRLAVTGTTPAPVEVEATALVGGQPVTVSQDVFAPTGTVVISGRVRAESTTQYVPNAEVRIFDADKNFVGGSVAGADGRFSARVPSSATRFIVAPDSVDASTLFRMMRFGGDTYTLVSDACYAPLGAISGSTKSLGEFEILRNLGSPPPPPTGCGN